MSTAQHPPQAEQADEISRRHWTELWDVPLLVAPVHDAWIMLIARPPVTYFSIILLFPAQQPAHPYLVPMAWWRALWRSGWARTGLGGWQSWPVPRSESHKSNYLGKAASGIFLATRCERLPPSWALSEIGKPAKVRLSCRVFVSPLPPPAFRRHCK